uniref:Uncharacterized protein n=1 Tax=Rousettus aegyptiacus TaxID=9407 RepID=A0A7J8FJC2_ROUAE|nr:hypothetical protein HJG63_011973 [Rousettus aegyptiacus]
MSRSGAQVEHYDGGEGCCVIGAGGTGPQEGHKRTGLLLKARVTLNLHHYCKVIRANTMESWHYMPGTVLYIIFSHVPFQVDHLIVLQMKRWRKGEVKTTCSGTPLEVAENGLGARRWNTIPLPHPQHSLPTAFCGGAGLRWAPPHCQALLFLLLSQGPPCSQY